MDREREREKSLVEEQGTHAPTTCPCASVDVPFARSLTSFGGCRRLGARRFHFLIGTRAKSARQRGRERMTIVNMGLVAVLAR